LYSIKIERVDDLCFLGEDELIQSDSNVTQFRLNYYFTSLIYW